MLGAQWLHTLLAIALSMVIVIPLRAMQRKLRIARGLAPLTGPKGVPLLGNIPAFIRNKHRMYHFLVRSAAASCHWDYPSHAWLSIHRKSNCGSMADA